VKQNKRTRRWQVSNFFVETTQTMKNILEIFKIVKLQPANSKEEFNLYSYYTTQNLKTLDYLPDEK
jgi:hypothetical protein